MNLQLNKPLVVLDLEATGVNPAKDRIVQIAMLKILPDGKQIEYNKLVNPEMDIPEYVSHIHGITNEMVKDKPTFKDIANEVINFLKDCDIAGYNSVKYDIPMLAEELMRAGVDFDFSKVKFVDVQTIYHKKEPRTLSAAYKFYCDKDLEGAHNAMNDVRATYEVLLSQLDKYNDLKNNVNFLSDFTTRRKFADFAGFIVYDDNGEEVFNFGKYKGQKVVDVFNKDSGYYGWIKKADFPAYTKKVVEKIWNKMKLQNKFNEIK